MVSSPCLALCLGASEVKLFSAAFALFAVKPCPQVKPYPI